MTLTCVGSLERPPQRILGRHHMLKCPARVEKDVSSSSVSWLEIIVEKTEKDNFLTYAWLLVPAVM